MSYLFLERNQALSSNNRREKDNYMITMPYKSCAPSSGEVTPRPTMAQVAVLAGVGIKTVSRVVNGEPYVSEKLTKRVQSAIEQLNYRPNLHAGTLRSKNAKDVSIGLLISNVADPYSGAVHRGIEDVAREHNAAVFASSLDDDPQRERSSIDAFLQRRLDALILTAVAPSQGYLATEQKHGTKLIFIDRIPRGIEADTVVSDNYKGACTATHHLIIHGHKRLAYLGDRQKITTAQDRRQGFLDTIGRAGIASANIPVIENLDNEEKARLAVHELMGQPIPPTALFTARNLVTIGAFRALRELELQHHIALVGFDDIPLSDLLEPAITVITQDPGRIGALAAQRAFARLAGDDSPAQKFIVPTRLITRGSGEIPAPKA